MKWLLIAALLPALAGASETRLPSEQERAGFEAYYLALNKVAPPLPPVYRVTRASTTGPWRIEAQLDGAGRRALGQLCRMERATFVNDGQWQAQANQQFAWLGVANCAVPAEPVALGQRMPDTDILALLQNQAQLLKRARLLFSGNSACAPQRAHNYQLTMIDVGKFINGAEEMATLGFRSDHGPTARVWVRRSGLAYDIWNVSCP